MSPNDLIAYHSEWDAELRRILGRHIEALFSSGWAPCMAPRWLHSYYVVHHDLSWTDLELSPSTVAALPALCAALLDANYNATAPQAVLSMIVLREAILALQPRAVWWRKVAKGRR